MLFSSWKQQFFLFANGQSLTRFVSRYSTFKVTSVHTSVRSFAVACPCFSSFAFMYGTHAREYCVKILSWNNFALFESYPCFYKNIADCCLIKTENELFSRQCPSSNDTCKQRIFREMLFQKINHWMVKRSSLSCQLA